MQRTIRLGNRQFHINDEGDRWYGRQFWDLYESGAWEPDTIAAFDAHITEESTFIDVGAAIGATALYVAGFAKRTIALEPNRDVFSLLERNSGLNIELGIETLNIALHAVGGDIEFSSGGRVFSDIVFTNSSSGYPVTCMSIGDLLAERAVEATGHNLFLKIDIEGGEFELIASPSFREFVIEVQPSIILALHPGAMARSGSSGSGRWRRWRIAKSLFREYRTVFWLVRKYRDVYFGQKRFRFWHLLNFRTYRPSHLPAPIELLFIADDQAS